MAIGLTVTKPFAEKCGSWPRVMVYAYQQVYVSLDTKINLMDSLNLDNFWWLYKVYAGDQFM